MSHFVYILANRPKGAIYVGSAFDLHQRMEQHHSGAVTGHAQRYNIKTLVWFEQHEKSVDAPHRERRLKRWRRDWKDRLIEEHNPEWRDVSTDIPN